MDSKTSVTFIRAYLEACELVEHLEERIREAHSRHEDVRTSIHERLVLLKEDRDMKHSFALSAIKSLTPARGFTV